MGVRPRKLKKGTFAGMLRDAAFLGGFAIGAYGVSLIYVPAAFIAGGLALSAIAYFADTDGPDQANPPRN